MQMENNRQRRVLLFIVLAAMLTPAIANLLNIKTTKLQGAIVDSPDVHLEVADWFRGNFQSGKNAYLNDAFGFRPDLIRVNNELDFLLYKKLKTNGVVVGKDNVLYEKSYIEEYCGKNPQDIPVISERMMKLKAIQDTLQRLGKTLLLMYAPSKAYFYPEDFPASMRCSGSLNNNYHNYLRLGDSLHINQLDCNGWFLKIKNRFKGMLVSKGGIHWTYYGALVAADSMVTVIEQQRHIRMPHFTWDSIQYEPGHLQEQDIMEALNLLKPPVKELYAHPVVKQDTGQTRIKPHIIFLGDSFLWTFAYTNVMSGCSTDWEFWYYFNEVWNQNTIAGKEDVKHISGYDWFNSLLQHDCIVLLYTAPNLTGLSSGFIEKAYDKFYPGKAIAIAK